MAEKGSIGAAIFWMCIISLLLCWLQFFGPLIAGFVGGKKAGGVGNALMAVFLPCILCGRRRVHLLYHGHFQPAGGGWLLP